MIKIAYLYDINMVFICCSYGYTYDIHMIWILTINNMNNIFMDKC